MPNSACNAHLFPGTWAPPRQKGRKIKSGERLSGHSASELCDKLEAYQPETTEVVIHSQIYQHKVQNMNQDVRTYGIGSYHELAHERVEKAAHRRAHQVTSATFHSAGDLTETGMRTSAAILLNVANGYRNIPAYFFANEVHRPSEEVVGLGGGLGVAGKEFVQGLYDTLTRPVKSLPTLARRTRNRLNLYMALGRDSGI
ncbi:Glycosyltransferase family 1 protein [Pyrenophora tritici-repentis]|nr:Glycosyltransferase family 1 protein [Pyrenophora tritici-repentis]